MTEEEITLQFYKELQEIKSYDGLPPWEELSQTKKDFISEMAHEFENRIQEYINTYQFDFIDEMEIDQRMNLIQFKKDNIEESKG